MKLTTTSRAPFLRRRQNATSKRREAWTTETLNGLDPDLKLISSLLTSIAARILQVSDKKASVALGAATNALAGSAFVAAVTGAVGSVGTAGTGAAIAGLFGAAKTSATLAWIGGVVGGGVAAGTMVLGAGALGVGLYGSVKVRRVLLGYARRSEAISPREQKILHAIQSLTASIAKSRESSKTTTAELKLFSHIGLSPLVAEIEQALADGCFADLTTYQRTRLRGHVINLKKLQKRLENE
ncbi:hypothetical protein OU789_01390 [Halocynthiibacter sp. C4]|uniref:hypothetical protein n=1 Tax=Halocynthiibacter sp. C4 TaxID=2992758 RepID=UPI00237ADFE9|nr:hypothetical protein [Halocynthiibacter sp. C4]MDE0588572.1 hypothetical protein [Halocynthiibacter sp. C4]